MSNDEQYVRLRNDVFRSVKYMLGERGAAIAGIPGTSVKLATYVNEVLINDLSCPVTLRHVFGEDIQGELERLAFKPGDRITISRAGTPGHYPPKDKLPEDGITVGS